MTRFTLRLKWHILQSLLKRKLLPFQLCQHFTTLMRKQSEQSRSFLVVSSLWILQTKKYSRCMRTERICLRVKDAQTPLNCFLGVKRCTKLGIRSVKSSIWLSGRKGRSMCGFTIWIKLSRNLMRSWLKTSREADSTLHQALNLKVYR